MNRLAIAAICAVSATMLFAKSDRKGKAKEPFGDDLLVQVKSSLDGTMQPCWFWAPEKARSEEHTSELQSPDNISYAVFCL